MDEVGWVLEIRFWVDGLGFRVSGLGWVWVVDIRRCGVWVGVGLVRVKLLHIAFNLNLLTIDGNESAEWLQIIEAGLFEPASGFKTISTSKASKAE